MVRSLTVVMLGAMALAQLSFANSGPQKVSAPNPPSKPDPPSGDLPSLPPLPKGVSTIMGGEIRNVNPVLDQFSLHVHGERPMKILFDARTQVYRNGVRIPLFNLGPSDFASVQTSLDGSNVFAISIHILSQAPQGDCQGLVLSYNPSTGELSVDSTLSPQPVHLFVPASTPINRVGEHVFTSGSSGLSDLVRGALVSIRFASRQRGSAVASQITILATPGSAFIFAGHITYLDVPAGQLVLVDPRDGKSYQISFDPGRFPVSASLHPGEKVTVTASYDGSRYVASEITPN
ncbi:MAG: hypothetical protein ACRD3N_18950 [Terracidiphilus sp.]